MKKVIQYRLPHSDIYTLTNIQYSGIEDGMACTCDNCGRLITNIANIKNNKGEKFNVGLDCAETLTGIGNTEDFEYAKINMREAIKLCKIIKEMHENETLKVKEINRDNNFFTFSFIGKIEKSIKFRGEKIKKLMQYNELVWNTQVTHALPQYIVNIIENNFNQQRK